MPTTHPNYQLVFCLQFPEVPPKTRPIFYSFQSHNFGDTARLVSGYLSVFNARLISYNAHFLFNTFTSICRCISTE